MKLLRNIIVIALCAMGTPALANIRRDLPNKAEVAELDGSETIDEAAKEITFPSDGDLEEVLRCKRASALQLSYAVADGKKWAACCLPGQKLMTSHGAAFDCCTAEGHYLAAGPNGKYSCCPTGQIFDGTICKDPPEPPKPAPKPDPTPGKLCPNGKPTGPNGECECDSGLTTGKCYTFTMENGKRLGILGAGRYYSAGDPSNAHQWGKFKLCKDEDCAPGQPINPADKVFIKNIHGNPNGGYGPNTWLNNAANGAHITKAPTFAQAGEFTLTKWPCGKYCLGGVDAGIGSTCPSAEPAMTFATADKEVCMPMTVTEVPCQIHNNDNNCIWDTAARQCCSDNKECKIDSKHTDL